MSGRVRSLFIIVILTAGFFLTGYTTERDLFRHPLGMGPAAAEEERPQIVATITLYNKIYSDLYISDGIPSMLNDLPAIRDVRHGIFRDIGYLRQEAKVLVYDMADLEPVEVRFTSPLSAEAVMLERWNYQYQHRSTRKPLAGAKGMGRGFRYDLIRFDGRWLVREWHPVSVEEPEIKDFRF